MTNAQNHLSAESLPLLQRLRPRLVISHIVLALVAIAAITAITLVQASRQLEELTFRQLESVAQLKENQIVRWTESVSTQLSLASVDLDDEADLIANLLSPEYDPEQAEPISEELAHNISEQGEEGEDGSVLFDELFIYDRDGRVVAASSEARLLTNISDEPYFLPSLRGDFIQHPYYEDETSTDLSMVVTHTYEVDGEIVGAIAGQLTLEIMGEIMLERAGLGETGESYLVSRETGHFITPSRFEGYELGRVYTSPVIEAALTNTADGSGQFDDYRGVPVYAVYHWIPQLNATLLSAIDVAEVQGAFVPTLRVILGVALGLALLAAVVGWIAASSVASPVVELARVASQIAQGDLKQRAHVRAQNEVGVLASAFDQMTERLTNSISELDSRVHELDKANAELRVATAKAREASRVKGEFLANVSHELRTPLNAIIGFSDMLLMGMSGELNPKQRHKMERLRENGVRLLGLINNILDITRIESKRIEIINKPFAPRSLATRVSDQMRVLADKQGLTFETQIDPALPETLLGDEGRIEQIVVNLLSNAFKFTEKGSVDLGLHATGDGKSWQIVVRDTGIGIPPHAIQLIFEEFRQVEGGSTRAYKGSGLGLAITRNLVRIMDGDIVVESEMGVGSVFTVTLPIIYTEDAAAPAANIAPALEV
jgi:signal transduction histidine kinase